MILSTLVLLWHRTPMCGASTCVSAWMSSQCVWKCDGDVFWVQWVLVITQLWMLSSEQLPLFSRSSPSLFYSQSLIHTHHTAAQHHSCQHAFNGVSFQHHTQAQWHMANALSEELVTGMVCARYTQQCVRSAALQQCPPSDIYVGCRTFVKTVPNASEIWN